MSLLKKLAGETAIYGVSSILGRLLHFVILTPYLTNVFDRTTYGTFSELYAYAALLMILLTYRMETTFFRFGKKREDLHRVFSTASISLFITTGLFVALMLLNYQSVSELLHYSGNPEYVIYFALILGMDTLVAIPFARLRLENRPIRFAVLKVLNIIVNIIFIFFFLEILPRLQGATGGVYQLDKVFLANLLASAVIFLALLPMYRKVRLAFDGALWKKMLLYAAPLIIAGVAGTINQMIGPPMLRWLAGLDQAGIYGAAAKIAVLINLFTQAFNYAAEPFFFRNADRSDVKQVYGQVGQAFTLVAAVAFLGIMLYMDVVQLMIGADKREGIAMVPILLMAYIFLGLFYNFSIWYKLADRTRVGGYIAIGGSLITIVLNLLLIPRYGFFGPAWAALACYVFMAVVTYWTGQRHYPIHYPVGRMLLYLLIALGGYGLSAWIRPLLPGQLSVTLIVNTLILLVCGGMYIGLEWPQVRRLLAGVRSK